MRAETSEHTKRILIIVAGILMVSGIAVYHLTDWIRPRPVKIFRLSASETGTPTPLTPYQSGDLLGARITPGPEATSLECSDIQGPGTMVLLTLGQSNAANHGESFYSPTGNVFSYYQGRCYPAKAYLYGATGKKGSVWPILADRLIREGYCDRVIIAALAVGGSCVERWTPDGDLFPSLVRTVKQMMEADLTPDYVLYHQGECNERFQTPKKEYMSSFLAMVRGIRDQGLKSPVLLATATMNMGELSEPVQEAQRALGQMHDQGLFPGPDTDRIQGPRFRFDQTHFSAEGLKAHAEAWLQAILACRQQLEPGK